MKKTILVLLCTLVFACFAQAQTNYGTTAVGNKFVDFAVKTFDGTNAKLSDYVGKGNYVLVDFWAYWCGPCLGEMPNLQKINADFGKKNFQLLSVSLDKNWDKTRKAVADNGMTWTQLMIEEFDVIKNSYGVKSIPHIILFGPDGTILERGLRGEGIRSALEKYMK